MEEPKQECVYCGAGGGRGVLGKRETGGVCKTRRLVREHERLEELRTRGAWAFGVRVWDRGTQGYGR